MSSPRKDAGDEQLRHRLLRAGAVEDHRDARRDDDCHRAAGGDQAERERPAVAVLDEIAVERLAGRRHGRRARAGNGAEDRRSADRGQAEVAAHPPQRASAPDDEPAGDAAAAHQLAGEDEEGHRQERVVLDPAVHDLMDHQGRHVHGRQDGQAARRQQDDVDREAEREERHRQEDQGPDHGTSDAGLAVSPASPPSPDPRPGRNTQ